MLDQENILTFSDIVTTSEYDNYYTTVCIRLSLNIHKIYYNLYKYKLIKYL